MKPITKQLIIGAFILVLVTVVSFGIRQVRFSIHRANNVESPVIADPEPDSIPADPHTDDVEPEPEDTDASDWDVEDEPDPQQATASVLEKETPSKVKSFKGKNVKTKGSKDLEKISLGDHENLYRTVEGQLWYVSKQPNGKSVKMQVYIDDTTGEITIVDAKSGGSKNTQKISLGAYENLYITEEGEQWYVSEQPDGAASKSRVLFDNTTGEVTVIEDYSTSDNGQERETKD